MLCPRCNSRLVACVGCENGQERYQCRLCTNEWYEGPGVAPPPPEAPQAPPEAPEPRGSDPGVRSARAAFKELEKMLAAQLDTARTNYNEAHNRRDPIDTHRFDGQIEVLSPALSYVQARIKQLEGIQ